MPRQRRRAGRRLRRRRRVTRRSTFGRNMRTMTIARGPSIMPDQTMVKLKYSASFDRTGLGPVDNYFFRGNSLNDPDQTGVGFQPVGYDQMAAFYSRSRVLACKIKVRLLSQTTGGGGFLRSVVLPTLSTTTSTNPAVQASNPYAKETYFGASQGQNKGFLRNYITSKKMFGIKSLAQEQAYSAAINANPASQWYWQVVTTALDGVSNFSYYLIVTLTYYTQFYSRNELNLS